MSQITIKELAELCGVAVSTVSRAMNDRSDVNPQTRARILAAAEKYGYIPNTSARSLKISSTNTIAVIIQGETSPLLLQILSLLESSLADHGYGLILSHVSDGSAHAATIARMVNERKYSGVVFLGRYGDEMSGGGPDLGRNLAEIGVPMVFCTTADFSGSTWNHSSVSVDDRAGGYELTRYLLDAGHRRIAFVGAQEKGDRQHVWALRNAGYRDALLEAGLEVDPTLILPAAHARGIYTMESGYESTRAHLESHGVDFTAMVAVCDAVAVGAIRALHEAGLQVPRDCSVTGFDDLDIARYSTPSLTTIAQPLEDIAATTARVLLLAVDQPDSVAEQVWVRGRLVTRESTGAL